MARYASLARIVFLQVLLRETWTSADDRFVATTTSSSGIGYEWLELVKILYVLLSRAVAALARNANLKMRRRFRLVGVAFHTSLLAAVYQWQTRKLGWKRGTVVPLVAKSIRHSLASGNKEGNDEHSKDERDSWYLWSHQSLQALFNAFLFDFPMTLLRCNSRLYSP